MADFWGGFAQGLQGGAGIGLQAAQLRGNLEAQRQKQALAAQQQAAEVLGKFADVLKDAPDEQVPILTKNMLNWYSQTRGIPISKEVMNIINSDPKGMTAMLMNSQGENGMTMQDMDKAFSDPMVFIGLTDAYNKRNKAKNAEAATAEGMGGPAVTQATSTGFPQGTPLPTGTPQLGAAPQAGLGNLQGLQAAITRTQQAMATPGLGREQLSALQNRADNLQKQLELSLNNETLRTAGQLGIDYQNATPQVRALVQQQVFNNAGIQAQATASGQALGGLINRETAADTGLNPLSTVGEARGAQGMGAGQTRLPTTAELGDLATMRTATQERMKEYRQASVSAEKIDPQLDQLSALLDAGAKTGVTEPMAVKIKQLVGSITGQDFSGVGNQVLLQKVANSLSFPFLQQIGGNDSNSDRTFATSIVASLGDLPVANKVMVDFMKIANARTKEREVQHGKFVKVCGMDGRKCSVDFSEYWDDYKNSHSQRDKYDSVLKKYGLAVGAPAANQAAGAPPVPAAPVRSGAGASVADFSAPPPELPGLPTTLPNSTLPVIEGQGGAAYVSPRGIRPKF